MVERHEKRSCLWIKKRLKSLTKHSFSVSGGSWKVKFRYQRSSKGDGRSVDLYSRLNFFFLMSNRNKPYLRLLVTALVHPQFPGIPNAPL